jgi:pimeloyl-ACP methyl ester carboxylesterase
MIKADSFIAPDGQTIRLWRWPHQEGRDTLFWAHATGFHGRLYQPLLNELSGKFNVVAWDMRGHGESDESKSLSQFNSWDTYYRDLTTFLRNQNRPIFVAGHSVGGMTALAASALCADKVAAVFLVDPVVFDRRTGWSFGLAKRLGQGHKMHLAKGAARRKSTFSSKQQALQNFQCKKAFSSWGDDWLSLYVEHGLKKDGDHYVLSCRPEWEARSFTVSEHKPQRFMKGYPAHIPVHILVAEHGSTFFNSARAMMKGYIPQANIQTLPGSTHFLPMENTLGVANWILDKT